LAGTVQKITSKSCSQRERNRGTMKKLLVITIAAAGLLAMQARAAVKIEMLAGFLYDHYGNPYRPTLTLPG